MRHSLSLVAGLLLGLSCVLAPALRAEVVRPAPLFTWTDAAGKSRSSSEFRGQAIVLLIADSPRQWAFRSQIGQIQSLYERMAAQRVLFAAAFTREPGVVRSNIPFVIAPDGPRTGQDFGAPTGFAIAIIGRDGNLDYFGTRVVPGQRVFDILNNSFAVQQSQRRP